MLQKGDIHSSSRLTSNWKKIKEGSRFPLITNCKHTIAQKTLSKCKHIPNNCKPNVFLPTLTQYKTKIKVWIGF